MGSDESSVNLVLSPPLNVLTSAHDVLAGPTSPTKQATPSTGTGQESCTPYRGSFGDVGGASGPNDCRWADDTVLLSPRR